MIKIYTMEVIGVDDDDNDRQLFKLRTFEENCVVLTIDTVVSPGELAVLCDAIQQAMERLELEGSIHD